MNTTDANEIIFLLDSPFKRGQRVRLKKGCRISRTTHPQKNAGDLIGRATEVTVSHHSKGYQPFAGEPGRNAEIVWVGAGGYWFHSDDFKNMEVVS